MLHQVSLTSDCAQQSSLSCLIEKKKCFSKAAVWKSCVFQILLAQAFLFSPLCCHILLCQKFLSLFQSAGIKWCFITPDRLSCRHRISEDKWLSGAPALCVKNSTARRAFCQTSMQQLGLSTKGVPLCCWGYRWQVPLRCGCLKIKRSSVV